MKPPDWIWDPQKADLNKRKHLVSFELAALVFEDPFHLSSPDPHETEHRWRTLGMVGGILLFVVHTFSNDDLAPPAGRIISARKATARERRAYEYGE